MKPKKDPYRKVSPRIWNDEKFRRLSDDAQLMFLFLLTHPSMTAIGAMRATVAGLAAERASRQHDGMLPGMAGGLSAERMAQCERAIRDLIAGGMVVVDESACYIGLPRFVRYNHPHSPNHVRSWVYALNMVPECDARAEQIERARAEMETIGAGFVGAFVETFGEGSKPSGKPCAMPSPMPSPMPNAMPIDKAYPKVAPKVDPQVAPNQEHKQEQEQEYKTPLPPEAGGDAAADPADTEWRACFDAVADWWGSAGGISANALVGLLEVHGLENIRRCLAYAKATGQRARYDPVGWLGRILERERDVGYTFAAPNAPNAARGNGGAFAGKPRGLDVEAMAAARRASEERQRLLREAGVRP